jgi:hypothetical protein
VAVAIFTGEAHDSAGYPAGFGTSLGCTGLGCIVIPLIYWYVVRRINAQRDTIAPEEIAAKYSAEELHEMGDLAPTYRYEK